ncbi:MAG: nitroreductase family protein [Thermodesulfobacteriota bacterium]|nr:nitroreductase family protein [Thermodesulfobacteriota bacterium]
MNLLEVNIETCNKDGICAATCPVGIIEVQNAQYPTLIDGAEDLCIQCGHCVAVCPTASLSHCDIPIDKCPTIQKELQISLAQCEQFLRARRSIRTYKEQSVPKSEVLKLIDLARYAPTGHNSQSVQWLVLGDRDELKHLAGITVEWLRWMLGNMSEFALSLHMDMAIQRWEEGNDIILRGAPIVIVAHASKDDHMAPTSSTIALSYLELASTSMGLGCCWAGYFHAAATTFPLMIEALPLPDGHKCLGAMMMGYPRFSFHRLPLRNQPEIIWRL